METKVSYVTYINETAARHLYKSANWTVFFAVLGYIGAGLLFFLSIVMFVGGGLFSRFGGPAFQQMPFSFGWLGFIYIPFCVFYIWVSTLMIQFASKAKAGLKNNDDELIALSFRKMNMFLAIMGVVTIVFIALYVIAMIVFFVGMISGQMGAFS